MIIRAVILDYGMVLCTPDPLAHANLLAITGLERDVFEGIYWRDRRTYDLGLLDGPGFWVRFAGEAGLALTPEQIQQLVANDVRLWVGTLNTPMLAWATALQEAGLRTAILSNMVGEVLREMRREFAWLNRFTHLTWSCELGIAKPDPAIYRWTWEHLGVPPEETLFVDDNPENVRAAGDLGIHAIQFHSVDQLRAELAEQGLLQGLPQPGEDEMVTRA